MRVLTALSAGLAVAVSALPSFTTASQVAVLDDDLKVPGENPMDYCAKPSKDWILDLESVDLSPSLPKPGENLTVTAKGTLSEEVGEGAKVHLLVKYGVIPIVTQTLDLCDLVKNVNLTCPIDKGETELTKIVAIPKQIPPGKYTVIANVTSESLKQVTCFTATVQFARGGSVAEIFKQGL